ncbi:hypothetical protein [Pendulispora albinea]|uniref:Outer membrane protein beta-barrel domain-containing protein n=1 Tax=Pendulispora albinea TaxID=2741071 RepID=A0ABZ2LZY8_9BACT
MSAPSSHWRSHSRLRARAGGLCATALGLAAMAAIASSSREAHAFERQQHIGLGGGLALLKAKDMSLAAGGGGSFHYAYGLTDSLNFVAEAGTSVVSLSYANPSAIMTKDSRSLFASHLGAGVTYSFDVIQWVPYVGVLASGYLLHGKALEDPVGAAGAQIALGIDYQVSRTVAVGLALRQHFILSKISDYPSYTTAFLRAEYVWGW